MDFFNYYIKESLRRGLVLLVTFLNMDARSYSPGKCTVLGNGMYTVEVE